MDQFSSCDAILFPSDGKYFAFPVITSRSSSCPWLGRPPSLVQLMTTYDYLEIRWKPVTYLSSRLDLCQVSTRRIQPPHLECLIQKFTWIMYVFRAFFLRSKVLTIAILLDCRRSRIESMEIPSM
jgi:hypothetical protein